MTARYYLLYGGLNVARAVDVNYAYLEHDSGKWVSTNILFNAITGAGGDSDTKEISRDQAQQWIERNKPKLNAVSLTHSDT